jgi:hypothetical protein
MMKKLLIFMLVLGLSSMPSMATAVPYFQVDPASQKDSYMPSDVIKIDVVDTQPIITMVIDAISDGGAGGMAEGPQVFNTNFLSHVDGELNSDGQLVEYFFANDTTIPVRGASGILYSFYYHVPNVPYSTMIPIGTYYNDVDWLAPEITYASGQFYNDNLTPTMIHVTPEPATIALLGLGGLLLRRRK